MQLPGIPGALEDNVVREKAEAEAERLLEDLKKEVKAEIRDIGTLRKELQITVPEKVIADHLTHNYDELMHDAIVPGFRKGRAPRALIEKRYGADVRESLTTSIVGQSYFAVTENHKLDVLGDPLFRIESDGGVKLVSFDEALQHLKLPPSGSLVYTCEVELRPEFTLPELKGIEVKTPEIEITSEMLERELLNQRRLRGRYEPQPEGTAERDDMLVADVTLRVGEQVVKTEENVQCGVRPAAIDGVPVPKLDEALIGARAGETREVECTIPDDYERADLRGQAGRFQFKIHELKRLVPMTLAEFLERSGFADEGEARDFLRIRMENERDQMIEAARRAQVSDYLLQQTPVELPEKLSGRQVERAVARRMVELLQGGMPPADVEARADQLRASAREEVTRDLKLSFILDKIAEQLEIQVTDEEVNTAIAALARRQNRRFDRVRDELQRDDLLGQLADGIRHDKTIERLLADANTVAVRAGDSAAPPAQE